MNKYSHFDKKYPKKLKIRITMMCFLCLRLNRAVAKELIFFAKKNLKKWINGGVWLSGDLCALSGGSIEASDLHKIS